MSRKPKSRATFIRSAGTRSPIEATPIEATPWGVSADAWKGIRDKGRQLGLDTPESIFLWLEEKIGTDEAKRRLYRLNLLNGMLDRELQTRHAGFIRDDGPLTVDDAHPPRPLTDTEQQVDEAIRTGCGSLKEISKATGIGEKTLTTHTIPGLKAKRGLLSRPYRYK